MIVCTQTMQLHDTRRYCRIVKGNLRETGEYSSIDKWEALP